MNIEFIRQTQHIGRGLSPWLVQQTSEFTLSNLQPNDTLIASLLREFDVKTEQDCSLTLTHRESGRQVSYHMDRRRKLSQSFFEQAYNLCKNYFPQAEFLRIFTAQLVQGARLS